jgi:FixJ family two-component response regulator
MSIISYIGSRKTRTVATPTGVLQLITEPLVAVVDDDDGMRTSLDALVRSLGYRTATFSNAEGLLASEHALAAACIISDIEMPNGMNGISLAAKIAAEDPGKPIILISAFVDDGVREAGIGAGAIAVLKKPFVGEALINIIDGALRPQT